MSRRRRGLRHHPFKLNLKKETVFAVSSTILFIIAGLTILSFSQQGSLLQLFHSFVVSLFGWGAILLAFVFISAGLMLTRLKWRLAKPNVLVGGLLIFIASIGLTKSGTAGNQVWEGLKSLISGIGAALMLTGSLFIGFLVLFETSLEDVLLFTAGVVKIIKSFWRVLFRPKEKMLLLNTNKIQIKGLTEGIKAPISKPTSPDKNKPPLELLEPTLASKIPAATSKVWRYPDLSMLTDAVGGEADAGNVNENAHIIEKNLDSFGIQAKVVEANCGPAVTQYALQIASGTKLSKITALANDLALALAAPTGQIRIEAPIPGRSLVGVEVPNRSLEIVTLKRMLTSDAMKKAKSKLSIGLGADVSGHAVVDDIGRMPHVLIAGSTGSGKSVAINSFIATILFRATPSEVKFILIDPKRVELTQYNGIPHLLTPVIVEPDKVLAALKWAVSEMERRYKLFAAAGVRNIDSYNESAGFQTLEYIVIIIDELADIMLFAPSDVEDTITRIAQMARATGIHLIVSTQRPSVDVITGLIKANIPCRIAFNVSSMVDSRVIIDTPGAEKLLGKGDMLYIPPNQAKPSRIQGPYVSDIEIQSLIKFLKQSGFSPHYTEEVISKYPVRNQQPGRGTAEETDNLFEEALKIVCSFDKASASLLQRRLSIGYARAARILDQLESAGIVGQAEGSKPREVLVKNADEYLTQYQE